MLLAWCRPWGSALPARQSFPHIRPASYLELLDLTLEPSRRHRKFRAQAIRPRLRFDEGQRQRIFETAGGEAEDCAQRDAHRNKRRSQRALGRSHHRCAGCRSAGRDRRSLITVVPSLPACAAVSARHDRAIEILKNLFTWVPALGGMKDVFWIAAVALPLIAGMQSFAINYGYRGMSRTEAFAKAREVVILLAIVEAIGFFIWNTVSLGM